MNPTFLCQSIEFTWAKQSSKHVRYVWMSFHVHDGIGISSWEWQEKGPRVIFFDLCLLEQKIDKEEIKEQQKSVILEQG